MTTPVEILGILGAFQTCLHGARQMHQFVRSYRHIDTDMIELDLRIEEANAYLWSFGRIHDLILQGDATATQTPPNSQGASPSWKELANRRLVISQEHIQSAVQILKKYLTAPEDRAVSRQRTNSSELFGVDTIPTRSSTLEDSATALESRRDSIKSLGPRKTSTWSARDKQRLKDAVAQFQDDVKSLVNLTTPKFWIIMHEATVSALRSRREEGGSTPASSVSGDLDQGQRVKQELQALDLSRRLDSESHAEKESRGLSFDASFPHLAQEDLPTHPSRAVVSLVNGQSTQPVLVEWKGYDGREMTRDQVIRRVSDVVCMLNSPASFLHNVLPSLGFFEDARSNTSPLHWVGIVYDMSTLGTRKKMRTLRELLQKPSPSRESRSHWKPPLGHRFDLALQLAKTVLAIHNCGWFHKGLLPENVVFFTTSENSVADPYLLGWEYSRSGKPGERSEEIRTISADAELYRHPDYYKDCDAGDGRYKASFDHYQLGCLLLEIGMWKLLGDTGGLRRTDRPDDTWREICHYRLVNKATRLAVDMGEIYSDVVRKLLTGVSQDGSDGEFWDVVVLQLTKCCA